jgi:hypothetical protein
MAQTAPFLFESTPKHPLVLEFESLVQKQTQKTSESATLLDSADIFAISFRAHWLTLGAFASADLEHGRHLRLWQTKGQSEYSLSTLEQMSAEVLRAYHWDFKPFSNRWVKSPISDGCIAAHQGDWLCVAVQAYVAIQKRLPEQALQLFDLIQFELTREAKIYFEFKRAHDGLGLLKASSLIAHHLSDLDRTILASGLDPNDPLYLFAFHAGAETGSRALRFSGALVEATKVNRALMLPENHRHFALSTPRGLKKSLKFLLPIAPFFDDWGRELAHAMSPKELAEIIEILYLGWEELKGHEKATMTYAYPRAVAGILEAAPGGLSALLPFLTPGIERHLISGLFHSLFTIPQSRFENEWAQRTLATLAT